jgi:prepilin-type N-terminal cleavage/methylation domain-containing protein
MSSRPRSGFSLIEALVVLAIGGMALAIIFSIGTKAGDTGFGLGRRAMAASDADVAASDLRAIIRSLALRPTATHMAGVDQPTVGETLRLESDVVMERATQCAPEGWAGRLSLIVEPRGAGSVLICSAAGRQTTLFTLPAGAAALSYSKDGTAWSPTYDNRPEPGAAFEQAEVETVFVRFAAPPLADIVEMASSGRPETWVRYETE